MLFLIADRILDGDDHGFVIAGKYLLNEFFFGLFGQQADYGRDDHAGNHAERAGVDGRLQQSGEQGLKGRVGQLAHTPSLVARFQYRP